MGGVRIPDEAFVAHTQGKIDDTELDGLEKFASLLSKESSAPIPSPVSSATATAAANLMQHPYVRATLKGVGTAAGALGLTLAGHAIGSGLAEMKDRLTFRRDLNRILEVHPDLAQDYPDKDIHLVYSSIRSMNPDFAKDPLIGGMLLGQILRNRDPLNPSGPPRFDPNTAQGLYSSNKRDRGGLSEAMQEAAMMGYKSALKSK